MSKNNKEFKTGDVVSLKSGGPKMTVKSMSDNMRIIKCVWFSNKQPYEYEFSVERLRLHKKHE